MSFFHGVSSPTFTGTPNIPIASGTVIGPDQPIVTGPSGSSSVFSSFITGTAAASASYATSTASSTGVANAEPGNVFDPIFGTYLDVYDSLNASLGALVLGLLFSSIAFGIVCMKAASYLRSSRSGAAAAKTFAVGLVSLNLLQTIFTAIAVYKSMVVDFGQLNALLDNHWSIIVQIGYMMFIASIVQCYFAYRLHIVKRNYFLTGAIAFCVILEFALAVCSSVQMYYENYSTVMLFNTGESWPMITTFAISAGINIAIAAHGYMWLQKPYVLQRKGQTTFIDEAEYWTFKSLFVCGLLSLYNAIAVAIMGLNLSWLAVTFVLGNLYTLSVLLNLSERRGTTPTVLKGPRAPTLDADSIRPPSTATLTNDTSLWEDVLKNQMLAAVEPSAMIVTKGASEKELYGLGYHTGGSILRPMTPRPALAPKSRPLSAIFIGSAGSTPPTLPDLPEPPSPSSSSGLPSPPATNSTGSGSVGEGSTTAGSLRHRTTSFKATSDMSGGSGDRSYTYSKKRSSVVEDEDDPDENENDEDHTARLSDDRRREFPKAASDNLAAVQRVKNLTQRNRMVLDKLSSISRLGSPVPSNHSRSPMSPPTAVSSASSATSSRSSGSQLRPQSVSNGSSNGRRRDIQLSGSETERESQHHSNHSVSSDGRSGSPPPSAYPEIRAPASVRPRRISAPASPGKAGRSYRETERPSSPGPSRKRVSTALSVDEGFGQYRSDDEDITAAALAAVANSRRSPGSGKKGRQPLPKEFMERKTPDEKAIPEPATPHRHSTRIDLGRGSPSPRKNRQVPSDPPLSPRRLGLSRYSTVRDLTRRHQTRWMSEDLSSPSRENPDESYDSVPGRRQGHRAGSSEGLLGTAGGRSLIGEGLRAAGLTKRRDDDVFSPTNGDPHPVVPRRTRSTGNSSVIAGGHGEASPEQGRESRTIRIDEGVGPPRDPKTPHSRLLDRRPQSGLVNRPGTSMAAFHHDTHELVPPKTAPAQLRTYKSTYALHDRVLEDLQRGSNYERASSSSPSVRASTAQGGARDNNAEHRRLMFDSLSMFESQLSRLPPMGQTTTTTIPEVFQSAQHLVHALDKLNGMLKDGTNKALEAQIDAEVADHRDGVDLVGLWQEVGAEHRENLRVSDEVVRNMTGFLLGVGKILREATSGGLMHHRAVSLDEDAVRRATPDVHASGGRDSDGRRSRESRRSWEPGGGAARLMTRLSSLERNGTRSRPGSSMNMMRSSTTSSSEGRNSSDAANDGTPATVRQSAPISGGSLAARRLYMPRELTGPLVTSLSTEDLHDDYEPSPTPVSRSANVSLPERRLPALAVPPSLPTLPSESLLTRSNSSATDKTSRRKISTSSIVTVRAEPSPFVPVIKPSNPTTAVTTHTVSASPETDRAPFQMLRSESGSSSRTNGVTFSRPSTSSVSSALSGLQQQHDRVLAPAAPISSSTSGSESERESRWRTISTRPRVSLDSNRSGNSPIDALADRSLASTVSYSAARKERRRTITEIFHER
ncbi:hypothetical protein C8Q70DRAFT_1051513 [Cubamyces menziesii]|nr:hypothetical protein C8Q70DRAFT_1051513 [Cubamyces menziesii]